MFEEAMSFVRSRPAMIAMFENKTLQMPCGCEKCGSVHVYSMDPWQKRRKTQTGKRSYDLLCSGELAGIPTFYDLMHEYHSVLNPRAGKPWFKCWSCKTEYEEIPWLFLPHLDGSYCDPSGLDALLTLMEDPEADDLPRYSDTSDVYFVGAVGHWVKIGIAQHVPSRLSSLQTGCPLPLDLLGVIKKGGRTLEAKLHKRFAEQRTHGEWFLVCPDILEYIETHATQVSA